MICSARSRRPASQANTPNKDAFVAASKPVYEEFAKEVAGSKEMIDRAIALGK